jgi:lipopolysaccharide/colanic/teichoic acid biosynthesis glycosyltransferase
MAPSLQSALLLSERFLAAFAVFFLWRALATIAIFIRITAGKPILVVDEWVNKGGAAVRAHRFRTTGPGLPVFRAAGRLIRDYALDELPSLWNVACGELRLRDLNLMRFR